MTRQLAVVSSADPLEVMTALRHAISGDGPAILPHPGAPVGLPSVVEKRIAVVIETSGSTGSPKRVALSADALLAGVAATDSVLGGPGQWMLALPAHYIAGVTVLLRSIAAGTDPVILRGAFDPVRFADEAAALQAERRYVSLVPAQLSRLVDAAEQEIGILEAARRFDRILIGGQAAPAALLARSLELGLTVSTTYGSSETSGGCVYDGVPIGSVAMRIVDGEVELSGPVLAQGYLGDPAHTAVAFVEDSGVRWYRTGDTGSIDDGVLNVIGRLDGMIISGGVKVSLDEVEAVVRAVPGLGDAVVVRAASERWGEVPVVVSIAEADLAAVRAAVASVLHRAAAPAALLRVDAIPLTANGKPDRPALETIVRARAQHVQ
ncbi:o-succinylbenzoate--CoA ligase [soil metagenome]